MKWLWILAIGLSAGSALKALPVDEPEYDRNGKPWFEKYFDQGRVDEITGYKPEKDWRKKRSAKFVDIKVTRELPASLDLRKEHPSGHLQPIKRQRCGDCWAHSVIATLESNWMLQHPEEEPQIYAQQELISCRGTGGSCGGGTWEAFNYATAKKGPGLPMEADFPYQGHGTRCSSDVEKKPRGVDWFYIGKRDDLRGPSIDQMKQALMDYGSLSVGVHAFKHSGDSIVQSCTNGGVNHMVNIEGWVNFDNEEDKEKYHSEGYWIMRNSWGDSFGEHGYAKVPFTDRSGRHCNNLGTTTAVADVD